MREVLKPLAQDEPTDWNLRFNCPGCGFWHLVRTTGDERPRWKWNGDMINPTFEPSILVKGEYVCHSYIRNGNIQFLNDCTHDMAGKTVRLPDVNSS